MQSLFIISLPRSLSTQANAIVQRALGLRSPSWALDGEILNVDRYAHYSSVRFDEGIKFVRADHDPRLFAQLSQFLDQAAVSEGFVYKDVTQPFVLAAWAGLRRFKVLKLERDLTDVAFSMLQQGWFYPSRGADSPKRSPLLLGLARRFATFHSSRVIHRPFRALMRDAVIEGLFNAKQALDSIEGVTLRHEDLVRDENSLLRALEELYPEARLAPISYIDQAFAVGRERISIRRRRRDYRFLKARAEEIQARIAAGHAGTDRNHHAKDARDRLATKS